MKRLVFALTALLCAAPASAHRPSDAYLVLAHSPASSALSGHLDVALRDLSAALDLDDGDGLLRARELVQGAPEIAALLQRSITFSAAGNAANATWGAPSLVAHSDGGYARFPVQVVVPTGARSVRVAYRLFGDLDPSHRGVLRYATGDREQLVVTSAALPAPELALESAGETSGFGARVEEGARHISAGLDHVLFLACLALGCLNAGLGRPAPLVRSILQVVTAFTLAHSVTLACVALGLLRVASDVIEPAIALSVALTALLNAVGGAVDRRLHAVLAFSLGLLHGCGFASGFADAGLRGARLAAALLGFNLGIELGQLAVLACVLPVGLLLMRTPRAFVLGLRGGSAAVAILSLCWLVQRLNLE